MQPDQPARLVRATRIRLSIAIPLTTLCFSVASGYWTFFLAQEWVPHERWPPSRLELYVKLSTLAIGVVGALAGWVIARSIITPIMRLTSLVKSITVSDIAGAEEPRRENEVGALVTAFDRMLLSMNKYISDSYILDKLPTAVVTIDGEGFIVSLNATAEQAWGYGLSTIRGASEGRPTPPCFAPPWTIGTCSGPSPRRSRSERVPPSKRRSDRSSPGMDERSP